mmetsp:Transcript_11687/g.43949  ORF Transcript_11687/g.43949 Transcript_11687/m.43949 type:complete len:419 (+) Transcript_11687:524-1780(+)
MSSTSQKLQRNEQPSKETAALSPSVVEFSASALTANDEFIRQEHDRVGRTKESFGYLKRTAVYNVYEKIFFGFTAFYTLLSLIGLFVLVPLFLSAQNMNWALILGLEVAVLSLMGLAFLGVTSVAAAFYCVKHLMRDEPQQDDKMAFTYDLRYAPNVRVNGNIVSETRQLRRMHGDFMEALGARHSHLKQTALEETEYVIWQQDISFMRSLQSHMRFFGFFALECLTAVVGFALVLLAIAFLYPVALPIAIYATFQLFIFGTLFVSYFILWRQVVAPNLNVTYLVTSTRCIRMSYSSVYQIAYQDLKRILSKDETIKMSQWGMLFSDRDHAIVGCYKKERPALYPNPSKKRAIIFPNVQPDAENDYVRNYLSEAVSRDGSPRDSELFMEEEIELPDIDESSVRIHVSPATSDADSLHD